MNAPETGADGTNATDAGAARNSPDQARLGRLADQRAALRRVATLVAGGARPAEVFTAVADELGHLIGAEATFVSRVDVSSPSRSRERRDPERHMTVVGSYGRVSEEVPIGFRIGLQPGMASTGTAVSFELPVPADGGQPDAGHDQ